MKKILLVLLAISLMLSIMGCSKPADEPTEERVKNSLFTDAFFIDMEEITFSGIGVVHGDQIEPVMEYLQGLTLAATNTHLTPQNGNYAGLNALTFRKCDGTEIRFYTDHVMLTCVSGMEQCSYEVQDVNLYLGLKEAFDRAIQQYPE